MKAERHPAIVALAAQIKKVRKDKGFTQEDFALAAGIDRSYYGAIERGERNISALNLMRIAVALKVEVGELFPETPKFERLLDGSVNADIGQE